MLCCSRRTRYTFFKLLRLLLHTWKRLVLLDASVAAQPDMSIFKQTLFARSRSSKTSASSEESFLANSARNDEIVFSMVCNTQSALCATCTSDLRVDPYENVAKGTLLADATFL